MLWFEGIDEPRYSEYNLASFTGRGACLDHVFWHKAELVEQNLPMPGNIRLFIFKTADEAPTYGSYVAQFYEGIHGVMDRPRVIEVNFPDNSVNEITSYGTSLESGLGILTRHYGRIEMSVGYGGHFYHPATLVMTIPKKQLSLEALRESLLAGKVKALPKGQHP